MRTCQICLKNYDLNCRKPQQLDCGHTFCLKCIYFLKKKKDSICPLDKKIFHRIKNENKNPIKNQKNFEIKNLKNQKIQNLKIHFDYTFNIITLGNNNTGKTSLLQKYFNNTYTTPKPTILIDYLQKTLKISKNKILLTAFDKTSPKNNKSITTPYISQKDKTSPKNNKSLTSSYISQKHCILYIFDITDKKSFLDIKKWKSFTDKKKKNNCIEILVGCKGDLVDERKVDVDEAICFVNEFRMSYFEVSSKMDINVDNLFGFIVMKCFKVFKNEKNEGFELEEGKKRKNKSFCNFLSDLLIF